MKVFLLLLGAQMVCQLEAAHHSHGSSTAHGPKKGGKVCAVAFWDHKKTPSAKDDLDDSVVVISTGVKAELPKGNMVEFGAMITEPGAWMTISDGAFVTIDGEGLDCDLEDCKSLKGKSTAAGYSELGYDRSSDEIVSCGHKEDKDKYTDFGKFCPKYNGDAVVTPGTKSCYIDGKETHHSSKDECAAYGIKTKSKYEFYTYPATTCYSLRKHYETMGGFAKIHKNSVAFFEAKCCEKDVSEDFKKYCPKFKYDRIITKPNEVCYIYGEGEREGYSKEECAAYGNKTKRKYEWLINPAVTCKTMYQHYGMMGGFFKLPKNQVAYFEGVCCEKYGADVEKICPKLDPKTVFEEGGHEYCDTYGKKFLTTPKTSEACKKGGGVWRKTPPMSCVMVASSIASRVKDGDTHTVTQFRERCCGYDHAGKITEDLKKACPKFKGDKIVYKESESCYIDGKQRSDLSKEECAAYGIKTKSKYEWHKSPAYTCMDSAKQIFAAGGFESDKVTKSYRFFFEGTCCDKYGAEVEKICPKLNPDGLFNEGGAEYCSNSPAKTAEACKKGGGDWLKSPPTTCASAATHIRSSGLAKVDPITVATFGSRCCGGSGLPDILKKACPVFDGKKIFDKGGSYYCVLDGDPVLSFVASEATCKELATKRKAKKFEFTKSPLMSCAMIAPVIGTKKGGLSEVGPGFKTIFLLNCCSGSSGTTPSAPKYPCPKFDPVRTIDGKSACGDVFKYYLTLDKSRPDKKATMDLIHSRCCGHETTAGPAICPNFRPKEKVPGASGSSCADVGVHFKSLIKIPAMLRAGFVKSCCGKKESSCPATCSGKTCDHWLKEASYTCKNLEKNYKCDCGGCECKVDEEQKKCAADLCFKRTCPEWEGKFGVKCEALTGVFGCSCNGCNCKKTLHKCNIPERKGDSYCDDENNKKHCDWDGGDCCELKEKNDKQFLYCKACKCLDPTGTPSKRACALPIHKGDNHCDDSNNKYSCGWDGGDCCGKSVNTKYCEDCRCVDPTFKGSRCIDQRLGDGFCDDANNVAACNYDKGDCCAHGHNSQFMYCHECKCRDPNVHKLREYCKGKCGSPSHKGDKYCDDDNNRCGCGWDGGDCCGRTGNSQQYEYCHQCKCLDAKYKKPACGVLKFKGDGHCDDDNNNKACGWDAGDCCPKPIDGKPRKKEQFKYCTKCQETCFEKYKL